MNGVCNNDDFWGFMWENSVVDTTSNGKEFSFRWSNVDSMVESFDHGFVENINMCNRQGDIIFDTHISYQKSIRQGGGGFNC